MSNSGKPKPWFEDAAALTKLHYTGTSDVAAKTEQRILEATSRKRRFFGSLWMVPAIIAGSASLAWADDVVQWTLEQVHLLVAAPQAVTEPEERPAPRVGASRHKVVAAAAASTIEDEIAIASAAPVTVASENAELAVQAPSAEAANQVELPGPVVNSGLRAKQRRSALTAETVLPGANPSSDLVMYRTGYAAQFERHDNAAALIAWDAYLKNVSGGRFAPEVRYHRAEALAALGRKAEALKALAPFASGAYGPSRQQDAQARISALRGER